MIIEDNSETQNMGSIPRPRTSQPNTYVRTSTHIKRPGDGSHPRGSGIGASDVNAIMEKKYSYDAEIQNNILSRLHEQNNMNQINLDQR